MRFVCLNTNSLEFDLAAKFTNKSLSMRDIVHISFGLKLHLLAQK